MPVPGPRTQRAPLPGYRNPRLPGVDQPGLEFPRRFNLWLRPPPLATPGRSPGLQWVNLRGELLGAGFIRYLWRQAINEVAAQAPVDWTRATPDPINGRPGLMSGYPGVDITRALRYMTRNVGPTAGVDNTRFEGLHSTVLPRQRRSPQARGQRITVAGGSVRSRPTVRNRLTSFGSRVPTVNKPSPDVEGG